MKDPVEVSGPVGAALDRGRPVVAMETSVLAQGLPSPQGAEVASAMSEAVREAGAEPAWTFVDAGTVHVGATPEDLARLLTPGLAVKAARRDLVPLVAQGGLGATTVSATLWIAERAGIEVAVTGGIGGVHRGSLDVSADLVELSRSSGLLVCSGPKTILDPGATLERLDELGVAVFGYGTDRLPFFVVREAEAHLDHVASTVEEVAAAARARRSLEMRSALLVCNPVPAEHALDPAVAEAAVAACAERARAEGIRGRALTPYLLSCLAERTAGASLAANVALLRSNAALAGQVAAALR